MFPRWLSWLFILMMGYLIYVGNRAANQIPQGAAPVEAPASAASSLQQYPSLQQLTNMDRWKRAMNPGHVGAAKITDTTVGTGAPAHCGAHVTIRLRGTLADGANFNTNHDESKSLKFTLGNAPYAVLNQGLVGMQQGGVRQISAPPQQVYAQGANTTRDDVLLRVEMDAIDSIAEDKNSLGLRVIQETEGEGAPAICGEPIAVSMTLWNNMNSVDYQTSKTITISLGKDKLTSGLTEGIGAMRVGETRTLILPPQSSMTSEYITLPAEIRNALGNGRTTVLSVTRK